MPDFNLKQTDVSPQTSKQDGDPANNSDGNLALADSFCRAWQELNTLNADNAVMVMLPVLSPEDINHFQRTLHIALNSDDPDCRHDARQLFDWLCEHKTLAESRFGTSHPGAFAGALHRTHPSNRERLSQAWQGLAPVLNPARLSPPQANQPESATSLWGRMYDYYLKLSGK